MRVFVISAVTSKWTTLGWASRRYPSAVSTLATAFKDELTRYSGSQLTKDKCFAVCLLSMRLEQGLKLVTDCLDLVRPTVFYPVGRERSILPIHRNHRFRSSHNNGEHLIC